MPRKLKVFRTPIGFHDAYVAAPSQKAALKAWGADVDLFARGTAELIEDDKLTREPLAHPGQVIRRVRGSTEEHLAALAAQQQPTTRLRNTEPAPDTKKATKRRATKPKPRPSRTKLDAAETALADAQARHEKAEQALRERERALERERRALLKPHEAESAKLQHAEERARAQFEAAMKKWRDG